VFAMAGIGRPEKFFHTLQAMGARVVGTRAFPDHHRYTLLEIEAVKQIATNAGALVVTTEKDAVRLHSLVGRGSGIGDRGSEVGDRDSEPVWAFLPMEILIEPGPSFAAWIDDRLRAARRDGSPRRTVEPALAGRVAARPDHGEGGGAA